MAEQDNFKLIQEVSGHLRRMRDFRRQYDAKRAEFYRQYIGSRTGRNFPDNVTPRSNTFVPYPYSNVQTIVSRVEDAFFSFDPWFEARPTTPADDANAESLQLVLGKKIDASNFYDAFEKLIRNICIYGHAGLKVDWDWTCDYITKPEAQFLPGPDGQPVIDPNTGQPVIIGVQMVPQKVERMRPKFTAIDVYDLLIDPDEAFVAHLTERTFGQILKEAEQNPQLYLPEAIQQLMQKLSKEKEPQNVIIRMAEFWDEQAGTQTIVTFGEDAEAVSWKDQRAAVRNANYSAYKRKVYGGAPLLLYHGENPFAHKKCPILHTSYSKVPGEVFGIGVIETISDLTEGLNKFVNMVTDNWNLGINQRFAYNTNIDIDHKALNNFNVPGGKVGVSGNPNEAIMQLPTHTPAAGDYAIIELYKGMLEMGSGISDFYSKGVGAPTGNRTATGINQVISEGNFIFKMFIRNLERDILQPMLKMCSSMVQQYISDEVEVLLTDAAPAIPKWHMVPAEKLIGNYDFDLVAANYATNKVIRQRQILAFANLAGGSAYLNEYEALLELGKLMEIRNMQKLLKTPEQVAYEMAMAKQEQIQMMIFEAMLNTESKARQAQAKPRTGQGEGGGRPRGAQMEGKIPGAGLTSSIREMAQSMGANSLGLEGLGDSGG